MSAKSGKKRRPSKALDTAKELNMVTRDSSKDLSKDTTKLAIDHAAVVNEISSKLNSHEWFHGMMPRDEIEELLRHEGDFLLRKTDVGHKPRIALSVFASNRIRHILLNYNDQKWYIRDLKMESVSDLIEGHMKNKVPVQNDGTCITTPIPRPDFYILHDSIVLGARLGGGAFGDVHKGVFKKMGEEIPVAVKKLKSDKIRKKQRIEFVHEARLMKRFDHYNVVKVLGIAPQEEPMLIVLEFCPFGALNAFLKKSTAISIDRLINYARDACRGMCYLSQRNIIHRDIAARNCLVGKEDDVKISDFGLSVASSELKLNKLNKMPIKWLAPETLQSGVFTTKSDVWSFGVMVWEIFSRCRTDPFPGESNQQARAKIMSGKQPLAPPDEMPTAMNVVMTLAFTQSPDQRPTFEALFKLLCPLEIPPAPPSGNDDIMKELEHFKQQSEMKERIATTKTDRTC